VIFSSNILKCDKEIDLLHFKFL